MSTKVTYIISDIKKALAFEWIVDNIDPSIFKLDFILLNNEDSYLEQFLIQKGIKVTRINYASKKNLLAAIFKTAWLLQKNKTDIVHTHLFNASFIGLIASYLVRVKKRIYTRHHSTSQHIYYPKAVKYDKLINYLATDIVAISEIVKKTLVEKENVDEKKIHLIHHGFQICEFEKTSQIENTILLQKYNPNLQQPVIGVISRYLELKGIQYIIPAFENILKKYPNALLILANATGNYKKDIHKLLKQIPKENYIEIVFENDLYSLYQLFDVFVHVPISEDVEAFGQTYVEALAAKIPSVFTLSGIANEFIRDMENAIVVKHKNSEDIYQAIIKLLSNKNLRESIKKNGFKDVSEKFEIKNMIDSLEKLYLHAK